MRFSYGRLACAVGEVHGVICVRDPHWGRARARENDNTASI